jgi:proteasome accessory factor C
MPELAHQQVQRLIGLVAWMSQRHTGDTIPYATAARHLGVTEATLRADLEVLVDLTDRYKPWLGSLSVAITARGFLLGSMGPFRRPLRLSRDEALALLVGLAGVRGGRELAARLGRDVGAAPEAGEVARAWVFGPTPGERVAQVLSLAREARDATRRLEITYCGSSAEPSTRVIHPHQVVEAGGAWYIVAWCEQAKGARHFRAERVIAAAMADGRFTPRPELRRVRTARDLLDAEGVPAATVRFSGRIVRWIRERYPDGEDSEGGYRVKFPVADPRWLAREVLQYGAEAEVVEPEAMREFVRKMLG